MPLQRVHRTLRRVLERPGTTSLERYRKLAVAAGPLEERFRAMPDGELGEAAARLRGTSGPFGPTEWVELCALGREAARRALGERPFDVQLCGMLAMLAGHVVEMATGEGKTLAGALAAAGFALQGRRVHAVPPNDYLARRDAEWMRPLYDLLGVSVGWVDQHSTPTQRREAYAADITHVSISELGFDVLRDRLRTVATDQVLPPLDVAIVDEADSVLIDEARVPLVLAGAASVAAGDPEIVALVADLDPSVHYETDDERRNVFLTDAGVDEVEQRLGGIELYDEDHPERLTEVNIALHAHVLLGRDVDYIVRDGKVELISISRGRVVRLQRWPDGLQAAVEAKEGLTPSASGEVLDSVLVQALISRYRTVCGMSGTVVAVAPQLEELYKLPVGRIPTNRPCVRVDEPDRLYSTMDGKEAAVVAHVVAVHATGRPVLLGTLDVAESERLASMLAAADIEAVVLNAKNDAHEAAIVARAGERGRVTISTQMAGRGTDIRLGGADSQDRQVVVGLDGLCVIGTGRYHTQRLDAQLRGRAGRQGDPGGSVVFTSVEDHLVRQHAPGLRTPRAVDSAGRVHDGRVEADVEHAQRVAEGAHLDSHRTTWHYHHLSGSQRAAVLDQRNRVLREDLAARVLARRCAKRYTSLRDEVGESVVDEAARQIVLYHLDRAWSDHLAFLVEVKEGIHLRAIVRETPLDEYHRIAIDEFAQFFEHAHAQAAVTFDKATITTAGVDLEALGLKRPTSTWTYMVNDNTLNGEQERLVSYFGRAIKKVVVKDA